MNTVLIEQGRRMVELEIVHIESEYAFVHNAQVIDEPKERKP